MQKGGSSAEDRAAAPKPKIQPSIGRDMALLEEVRVSAGAAWIVLTTS
jgi:hypothetical protein